MKQALLYPFCGLIALVALSTSAGAEEVATYRVDVIVFAHVIGGTEQRHQDSVLDYTRYPDVRAQARAAAWTRPIDAESLSAEERARRDALEALDQLRALEQNTPASVADFAGGPLFPPTWMAQPDLSPTMGDSWRRLLDSSRHVPLTWRSWYQPLAADTRSEWMRLQGQNLIDLDWLKPEAIDESFLPPEPPYPFLMPQTRHRLDGAIRIRQRQFMHVDLDLVWQTEASASPAPLANDWYQPEGFLTHPLNQSRSIRPNRIEYFDSSWLGVLVRIEAWESPLANTEDLTAAP
ncbi:MAG: CsiV family protein [Pseudomonadota bacterium]